jgi:hypothetical protein
MTINYEKVWEVMNDLEVSFTKITYLKDILESSQESMENGDEKKASSLIGASISILSWFIEEYDQKLTRAWNNTVKELNNQKLEKIRDFDRANTEIVSVEEAYDKEGNSIFSYINLPENILNNLDWEIGDNLEWIDNGDGTFLIKKQVGN